MEKVINFAPPSRAKEKQIVDAEEANKGFYSEEERSAAVQRSKKARTFGDTDDEAGTEPKKSEAKPSRFGGKKQSTKMEVQVEYPQSIKFVPRHNIILASETESKTLQAIEKRITTLETHPYINLMFSPNKRVSVFKKHLAMCFRGLTYSLKFLKGPSEKFIKSKEVVLNKPPNSKGRALVLDLDETLIHSCNYKEKPMFVIEMASEGVRESFGINVRPHCIQFLELMSEYYDLHVFTASTIGYAQPIIDFLNSNQKTINSILPRTACMQTKNGFFIKDLRIISNYELKDIIIVDNLVHSFGLQVDNGVPIIEYHDDRKDEELLYLREYLVEASKHPDLREFNRANLKLAKMIEVDYESLVKDL